VSARFPELRERTFDFGTLPVLRALRDFFTTANAARTIAARYGVSVDREPNAPATSR